MLSTCLLSDASLCLAGLNVDATVCMSAQGVGWILQGRTGCVNFATRLRTWRISSISYVVAQLTVMLDKSMPVFFNRHSLFQTVSLTPNQMHVTTVAVSSESVFHIGNVLSPPPPPYHLMLVFSLLALCWSPGLLHKNMKVKANGTLVTPAGL